MPDRNRRRFLKKTIWGTMGLIGGTRLPFVYGDDTDGSKSGRPNILFAMTDDWSWPHAGAYGDPVVKTPAFDRVAREGCLFTQAFAAAPQCSPNRAAILTGRNIWQLEEAGTHYSLFPNKFAVYPDLLEDAGYCVGGTGKLWSPGNWQEGGRARNPVGPEFNNRKMESVPTEGILLPDYAGNFKEFFEKRPKEKPFCFWYGGHEPHRKYAKGSGLESGKKPEDVQVPPFLPDNAEVRSDFLDYYLEVEWFDRHLGRMLELLEESGELENTILVVTGDNGMPFPRAKATLYEYGTHMPLAICWPKRVPGGRVIHDLTSSIDFAPTFLEAAGLTPPSDMTGRSLLDLLTSDQSGGVDGTRNEVFTGRERHSHSRPDNIGYPSRAIRTDQYLYIRNFKPDRWPIGDPEGFHDID
ncbi:MAG: sulfatase, partial [bacterium]